MRLLTSFPAPAPKAGSNQQHVNASQQKEKVLFAASRWHWHEGLASGVRIQISAANIGFPRSVSEQIRLQGLMSNVGFLTDSSTFIIQGGKKDAARHKPSGTPRVYVPGKTVCVSFPHWVNRPSVWQGQAPTLGRPLCWMLRTHLCPRDDRHQSQGFLEAEIFIRFVLLRTQGLAHSMGSVSTC